MERTILEVDRELISPFFAIRFRSKFIKIAFPRKVSRTKRNIAIGKKGKHSNVSNGADTLSGLRRVKNWISDQCLDSLLDFHQQQRAVISSNICDYVFSTYRRGRVT